MAADIDYARVKLKDWLLDDQLKPTLDEYTWWGHHMGTTRMGNIPSESIVDKNLKFHTLSNGYVLSSSTFPSVEPQILLLHSSIIFAACKLFQIIYLIF